jgi:predicted  nucleic acid-binding Zn-ribbon protein
LRHVYCAEKEQQLQNPALNARLTEAKALVAEKISKLPADWLKVFKRVELHEGADALSPLNGRSCAACYTEVTAQQFAMIQSGKMEACKNCSKLLYMQAVEVA